MVDAAEPSDYELRCLAEKRYRNDLEKAKEAYNKLSWMQRVKLDPERLDRLQKEQLSTFEIIIDRRRHELVPKINELFKEYWEKLLNEEISSIDKYLETID